MNNVTAVAKDLIDNTIQSEDGCLPEDADVRLHDAVVADMRLHLALLTQIIAQRPVKGSRGIRSRTVLSVFGPVFVSKKYVPRRGRSGNTVIVGCRNSTTRGVRKRISKCAALLGSFQDAAQTTGELLRFKISTSRTRKITLDEGARILKLSPMKSPVFDREQVVPGTCTSVEETLTISVDGTGVPCTKADTEGTRGHDGNPAKTREMKIGMVGKYKWLDKNRVPVLPADKRQYVVTYMDCDAIGKKILDLARVLGHGTVARVQFIGDGAHWIAAIAADLFKGAEFTIDFMHAAGYLNTLCVALDTVNHERLFKMARGIMKRYSADTALKYLKKKHPERIAALTQDEQKAYAYLDTRSKNMEYGRLRKEGFMIGSGHIEAGCKMLVATRCKLPGMHWRHKNSAYIVAIRAAIRSNTFCVT